MSKPMVIKIGALNIKTHPHSPENYIELFQDTFALGQSVRIHGDNYGMLGWRRFLNESSPEEGIYGEIYKYFNLDSKKPWLNVQENKKLSPEEITDIQIPDHLKPNLLSFRYLFFPKGHRLFFELYSDKNQIGVTAVERLFKRLFSHSSIKKKYGDVDVFIEPSREKLEEILSIYNLKRLEMRITKPNPDDPYEFEASVFKRMNIENSDIIDYALRGKHLTPGDETKKLARVAASNGFVKGFGTDEEGKKADESTVDHPLVDSISYLPDVHDPAETFRYKAREMMDKIRDWLLGGDA